MRTYSIACMCALAVMGVSVPAMAQAGGGGRGGFNRGNGGQFDPSQIQQMMSNAQQRQVDRIKGLFKNNLFNYFAVEQSYNSSLHETRAASNAHSPSPHRSP